MLGKNQTSSEAKEDPDRSPNSVGSGVADFSSSVRSKSYRAAKSSSSAGRSIIGYGVTITGDVVSKGEVLLEGDVEGDIHCKSMHVGVQSSLTGNVVAEEVTLHGRMKGSINCNDVLLKSDAYFEGDINCKSLAVEEGATFLGQSLPSDDPLTRPTVRGAPATESTAASLAGVGLEADAPKKAVI
jgi:cytoskeletal protein CcmA (bactofilin family)